MKKKKTIVALLLLSLCPIISNGQSNPVNDPDPCGCQNTYQGQLNVAGIEIEETKDNCAASTMPPSAYEVMASYVQEGTTGTEGPPPNAAEYFAAGDEWDKATAECKATADKAFDKKFDDLNTTLSSCNTACNGD